MKKIFLNLRPTTHMDSLHFQDDSLLMTVYTYISLTMDSAIIHIKRMKNICKML